MYDFSILSGNNFSSYVLVPLGTIGEENGLEIEMVGKVMAERKREKAERRRPSPRTTPPFLLEGATHNGLAALAARHCLWGTGAGGREKAADFSDKRSDRH